jgi:Zn-dependent M28 family amino/carboxypeptidase
MHALAPLALALAVSVTPAATGPSPASLAKTLSPAERAAAAHVTAAELSAHTRFLSDDLLEGRFPGQRGDELAIRYLAAQLEAPGYRPGATDAAGRPSWFQEVPLVRYAASVPASMTFRRGGAEVVLPTGPGVSAEVVVHSVGDVDRAAVKDAELVFVGYGIVAPEHGWDDYRNVDVRGKVVVVLNFNPPWAGEGVRLWYGRWDYKFLEAARHGAAGALLVHTTESASYPWQVVATSNGSLAFALPKEGEADARLPFQGWISHDATARLFRLAGRELAADEAAAKAPASKGAPGVALGVTTTLDLAVARERTTSANVVGVLPGRDPALRDEAVLLTAHHDHLGMRTPPVPGERNVYAGALDNASGCAATLTIARALATAAPRRSVVVAFVTAEEQGLLGSRWYATHPTVKAGRLAVDVNVDGVNRFGRTKDLSVLGLGKSTVDDVVKAVAAAQGRTVHGDPYPDRGSYYRSDHFELARVGVPSAEIGGGTIYVGRPDGWGKEQSERWIQANYHQPSDAYAPSPEAWDLSGAIEDAQLRLVVALRIANDPFLPRWTPGDEFEQARRSAAR